MKFIEFNYKQNIDRKFHLSFYKYNKISTVVLSILRRDRDLTDTLETHNSKTVSQKNFLWVEL